MADCVLVEMMAVCEDGLVNNDDILLESASEDSSNNSDNVKAGFFVLSVSDQLCSKYQINGAHLNSNIEFSDVLKTISEDNGNNCRKKRCDRYDSSESSDSGVANLSCTDCSSTGCSSGTSDITEPASPLSTSSHSESDVELSPSKMPPTQSTDGSTWPWDDHQSPQQRFFLHHNNTGRTQGKITEYFKTQHKIHKCDLTSENNICDIVCDNLAVHISGTVTAKLPFVFQQSPLTNKVTLTPRSENEAIPTPTSSHLVSPLQVTSVFREPKVVSKCSSSCVASDRDDSVLLSKPKAPPTEDSLKNTFSTPKPALNLFVSTVEQCVDKPSLPSPILRVPSTIRFPVRNGWKGHFLTGVVCRWMDCEESFGTTTALLEHLQAKHVNTQSLSETFVCHWTGCKVYDKASCSRSWLERHVLSHGGNKPFRCIVDGCGHRCSSQTTLERHVNQHFNQVESSSSGGPSSKRPLDSTPSKLFRRNGKKLRYRRQPFSARMCDYIDTGIMEGVQHSLLEVTKLQTLDCASTSSITLRSQVIGRRTTTDGKCQVLLRWFPNNIVSDEWVAQSEASQARQVSWKQCQDWCRPPLFHQRPSQRCRKLSTPR